MPCYRNDVLKLQVNFLEVLFFVQKIRSFFIDKVMYELKAAPGSVTAPGSCSGSISHEYGFETAKGSPVVPQ
jgi:hypothetical protein